MAWTACPECGKPMQVEYVDNGVAMTWHGVHCGWGQAYMADQDVHQTEAEVPQAYYFGCWDRPGHYLHDIKGHSVWTKPFGLPWDEGLMDSGLLKNGKREDIYDGKVFWTCGGRALFWFAFFWWDNSVDHRGASNSGIYVSGFKMGEAEKAFKFGCDAFPSVVARQKQPLVLQPRA